MTYDEVQEHEIMKKRKEIIDEKSVMIATKVITEYCRISHCKDCLFFKTECIWRNTPLKIKVVTDYKIQEVK